MQPANYNIAQPANDNIAPNPFAADDVRWSVVDNPNDEYAAFEHLRPRRDRREVNVIAEDITPTVAANVARYYGQKKEPWAASMATRLKATAANDNAAPAERSVAARRRAA